MTLILFIGAVSLACCAWGAWFYLAAMTTTQGETVKPIEAAAYVEGWDAMLMGKPRNANPYTYRGVRRSAWDSYREKYWHLGWVKCERGDKFVDPRKRTAPW